MKRNISFIIIAVMLLSLLLVGCREEHEVRFTVDGEEYYSLSVRDGEIFVPPPSPTRDGYAFLGWYMGEDKVNVFAQVVSDLQLEARFAPLDGIESSRGLKFTLNSDGHGYTLEGIGECTDDAIVVSLHKGRPVTAISPRAFVGNTDIFSVTLGAGVGEIGDGAFLGCTRLAEIINYSEINIVAGSTENGRVAEWALNVHSGESTLIRREGSIFLDTPTGLYLIYASPSDGRLVLPPSPTGEKYTVGVGVGALSSDIFSVEIPSDVREIADNAFVGEYRIAEVINHSELSITPGSSAFGSVARHALAVHGGDSMVRTAGDFVTLSLGDESYIVKYLGNEKAPVLPTDLAGGRYAIYTRAFYGNNNIRKIALPEGLFEIGSEAFALCTLLGSVTTPDSEHIIADRAFFDCVWLTELSLGLGLRSIGERAFAACPKIVSAVLPDGLISIGDRAFIFCEGLESITFTASVERIGDYAFAFHSPAGLTVHFVGTRSDWSGISMKNGSIYLKKIIYYTEIEI
ncbi:MAG: leucine-rich repeat protein [Clostridia bacterium]|nr:leucine-rich repeat protein [Clostridia bacterium]